jgi:hypothetical protein
MHRIHNTKTLKDAYLRGVRCARTEISSGKAMFTPSNARSDRRGLRSNARPRFYRAAGSQRNVPRYPHQPSQPTPMSMCIHLN